MKTLNYNSHWNASKRLDEEVKRLGYERFKLTERKIQIHNIALKRELTHGELGEIIYITRQYGEISKQYYSLKERSKKHMEQYNKLFAEEMLS